MTMIAASTNPHHDLIAALYAAVDDLDPAGVDAFVTPDVRFRLGNFDELQGRQAVVDANASFFRTIAAMRHVIEGISSDGDAVICSGSVHYTRQDGTLLAVPFATVLKLRDGLIADYRVYVDISPL